MTLPPVSAQASTEVTDIAKVFTDDLIEEAGRIAKRVGAQEASVQHVKTASERLYQGGTFRREQFHVGAGGLLAGIGGGAFFSAVQDQADEWIMFTTAGLLVVGIVLFMWAFRR